MTRDGPARQRRRAPRHPAAALVRPSGGAAGPALGGRCVVHHADRVPAAGGVILASNHIGIIDGPLLAIFAPRPVHALTKQEMFDGTARTLPARPPARSRSTASTPTRVRSGSCLRVLRDGGVVGIFPEGTRGDGELRPLPPRRRLPRARHRRPGRAGHDDRHPPARRRRQRPPGARRRRSTWSFGRAVADDTAALAPHPGTRGGHVGVAPRSTCCPSWPRALADTRRSLPGPLPAGQSEDDPDTGLVEPSREL